MSGPAPGDIALLAEAFASGGFRDLRVQTPHLSLHLSQDRNAPGITAAPQMPAALADVRAVPAEVTAPATHVDPSSSAPSTVSAGADLAQVCAPNLGTFYRSPKPGAAPFVEVGQVVGPDTELCLLEVMKLFTSVKAGVRGTVRKVCVEDGVLVEGGQLLFLIEAD